MDKQIDKIRKTIPRTIQSIREGDLSVLRKTAIKTSKQLITTLDMIKTKLDMTKGRGQKRMDEQMQQQFEEIRETLPRTVKAVKEDDDIESLRETAIELTKALTLTLEILHRNAERI